jgi:Endomembrane protein 70.
MNEFSWKSLARDVFRPPESPIVFSALTGVGLHLIATSLLIIILICLGVIKTEHHGNVMTVIVFLHPFMAFFAGLRAVQTCTVFDV